MTLKMESASKVLRYLLKALRTGTPNSENNVKNSLASRYILAQYEKYATTDQQLCKARDEAFFLARTYLTYLNSQKRYKELHKEYHGRGERTVRETADMVGFKLPTDPK